MRNYAIIGTGAIGGYCAVKLFQAGFSVHCLARSDYSHIKQHGLTLITPTEKIVAPVHVYDDSTEMPLCDVILITLKSTANHILKTILPRLMQAHTIVAVFQNGIGIEQELAEFIEPVNIIGGSTSIKVVKQSPGVVQHFGLNTIDLAQYYPEDNQTGISPNVTQVTQDLQQTGINVNSVPHLPTVRWMKLTANIPFSGLGVVLNASNQAMTRDPVSHELLCNLTQEVIAAATQCGAELSGDFYQTRLKMFEWFKTGEAFNSSMKDAYDHKQPLELNAIYENALNTARKNQATMPLTTMLYQQLLFLNARNLK